jgi:hypothetical protein
VTVDQIGIVTAALTFTEPPQDRRGWTTIEQLQTTILAPLIESAATLLQEAEFLGRTACHVVMNRLPALLLLRHAAERGPASYVPTQGMLDLPRDEEEIAKLALRGLNAVARSAGIQAWDALDERA